MSLEAQRLHDIGRNAIIEGVSSFWTTPFVCLSREDQEAMERVAERVSKRKLQSELDKLRSGYQELYREREQLRIENAMLKELVRPAEPKTIKRLEEVRDAITAEIKRLEGT